MEVIFHKLAYTFPHVYLYEPLFTGWYSLGALH